MHYLEIKKGNKSYSINDMIDSRYPERTLWLASEEGEGMQLGKEMEEKLFDVIDKFYQENF